MVTRWSLVTTELCSDVTRRLIALSWALPRRGGRGRGLGWARPRTEARPRHHGRMSRFWRRRGQLPKCGLGPCLQDHHHVASWHAVCTAGVGCPTDWPLGLTKQSFVVNCIIYHSWNCKMLTKYPKYFINLLRTQMFADWSPNFQIYFWCKIFCNNISELTRSWNSEWGRQRQRHLFFSFTCCGILFMNLF